MAGRSASREHTLILAPTGSGKTLAAFLWAIDQLVTDPAPDAARAHPRCCYISPLRALAVDVEKNLRAPLGRHPPRAPSASASRVQRADGRRCAPATRPSTRTAGAAAPTRPTC